jgi:hypothetical protein
MKKKTQRFSWIVRLFQDLKELEIDAFRRFTQCCVLRLFEPFCLEEKKTAVVDKGRAAKKALTQPENKVFKQLPTFERHIKVFKELGFTVDLSHAVFLKSNFEPKILAVIGKNQRN